MTGSLPGDMSSIVKRGSNDSDWGLLSSIEHLPALSDHPGIVTNVGRANGCVPDDCEVDSNVCTDDCEGDSDVCRLVDDEVMSEVDPLDRIANVHMTETDDVGDARLEDIPT